MAFDAGMLHAVVWELHGILSEGKVEKIHQPAKEEIVLVIRSRGESHRLCVQVGSHLPRLSLTRTERENPATPPMFCMLLRKHLSGARVVSVEQEGYERIARIRFSGQDEMGFSASKSLVAEVMGKYSNLMLLDGDDTIIAVMRPVDFTTSRVRQVLPGMRYELPPGQDKYPPLSETESHFMDAYCKADPSANCARWLSNTYLGTAVQTAREIVWEAAGDSEAPVAAVPPDALWTSFSRMRARLLNHDYTPTLAVRPDGTPLDFSYMPIGYFGGAAHTRTYPDFAALLDDCYGERDRADRIRQRAADLWGIVNRATARLTKKAEAQTAELRQAEEGDTYQRMGDLLTANLWHLKRGDSVAVCEDYTQDPPAACEIPLDSRLSPAANAQRYYRLYTKAKHARENLTRQLARCREELDYLDSVRVFLERAEGEGDLADIRCELANAGYLARRRAPNDRKPAKPRPMVFTSPAGYRVLVGRNNLQNDLLTFRLAGRGDLWFHAKGIPGSHVILEAKGEEPPAEDYTYAATLAARYSQAKGGTIAVDYTRVRYVRKPPASPPGYVTYRANYTAYVPIESEPEKEVPPSGVSHQHD